MNDLRALVRLARPRGAGFVLLLPMLGYGYAHWEHELPLRGVADIALVVVAWLFLHAGTMWLNAALDRDEGPVLYGDVTPVPRQTATAGYFALALCVSLAATTGLLTMLFIATCAAMAVAYSHPRLALKGHPQLGPCINVLGYGVLSPAAGFVVVAHAPTIRSLVVLLLFCSFILSLYFTAQCFQREDDAARGYRTMVVSHGPAATVRAARCCWWLGAIGVAGLAAMEWLPPICALALIVVPRLMYAGADAPTRADARRTTNGALIYGLLLLALAVTDHLHRAPRLGAITYARDGGGHTGAAGKTSTSTMPMLSLPP